MKSIVLVENDKVGLLADISYILAKSKINIDTINVNAVGGKVVLVLTVNDTRKALDVLKKNGYSSIEEDYFTIKVEDRPGELNKITVLLSQAKVNIENVHMLARDGKHSIVALKVDKVRKAKGVLKQYLVENEQ